MKKLILLLTITTAAFLTAYAQTSTGGGNIPKSPCDIAVWKAKNMPFPTLPIAIGADVLKIANLPATNVQFTAQLEWQQKDYIKPDNSNFICSLKDPKLTIAGQKTMQIPKAGDPDSPYTIMIEPESYGNDKFYIDNSIVTAAEYERIADIAEFGDPKAQPPVLPTFEYGKGGTTSSLIGGRSVTWVWLKDIVQPKSVSITGAEGKKIEISHHSPLVAVRAIWDKNGKLLNNAVIYFRHDWKMEHVVEAN